MGGAMMAWAPESRQPVDSLSRAADWCRPTSHHRRFSLATSPRTRHRFRHVADGQRWCSVSRCSLDNGRLLLQDRYAGDAGDFGKYGLLRWLCGPDAHGPVLRLGVLWYRFADATPGDGKYVSYLEPPRAQRFRKCDPDLFQRMRSIVHGERSIAAVETSGALPAGTAFFGEQLVFGRREPRESRASKRLRWLEAALHAMEDADLVFADPDNGLEIASVDRLHAKGPKYAYYDDLRACWDRGQSLVVYQHTARHAPVQEQMATRLDALREHLKGAEATLALRWRRFASRTYIVIPAAHHAKPLAARCSAFLASPWGQHFT